VSLMRLLCVVEISVCYNRVMYVWQGHDSFAVLRPKPVCLQ
jgi:hypothetical protein